MITVVFRQGGPVLTKEELVSRLLLDASRYRNEDPQTAKLLKKRAKELLQ